MTSGTSGPDQGSRVRQGTLPPDELDRLLAAMDEPGGWRTALSRLDLPVLSRKRFWFTDRKKADFYRTLPVGAHGRALDVGSGSGVIAEGLTVSLTIPGGNNVVAATGAGYQGVNQNVATWRLGRTANDIPREVAIGVPQNRPVARHTPHKCYGGVFGKWLG